jgi:DNA replication protein DnaC
MSGKTTVSAHLAEGAINKGFKVFYLKLDGMLLVIKNKDMLKKARATFNKLRNIDLLVLDEFFYLDQSREYLALIYKKLMGINETTSIIFISNREPSDWIASSVPLPHQRSSNSSPKQYYIFSHEIRPLAEIVRIIARF